MAALKPVSIAALLGSQTMTGALPALAAMIALAARRERSLSSA